MDLFSVMLLTIGVVAVAYTVFIANKDAARKAESAASKD